MLGSRFYVQNKKASFFAVGCGRWEEFGGAVILISVSRPPQPATAHRAHPHHGAFGAADRDERRPPGAIPAAGAGDDLHGAG
jgi:hypothetical protein